MHPSPFTSSVPPKDVRPTACSTLTSPLGPPLSRNGIVNRISLPRRPQEVLRHRLGDLSRLGPLPDRVEVLAPVLGVEVDEGLGGLGIPPDLAQESRVGGAHQLLAHDVQTVGHVVADDVVVVHEGALALGTVVVDVVVERLTHQVQTVQVVQTLDVGGKAAAVLGVDLDLLALQPGFEALADGNGEAAICGVVSRARDVGVEGDISQLMPSDSQAASTSGPAPNRNAFSLMNEPLKRTVWYALSTSATMGAISRSAYAPRSAVESSQYFWTCCKQDLSVVRLPAQAPRPKEASNARIAVPIAAQVGTRRETRGSDAPELSQNAFSQSSEDLKSLSRGLSMR